jgi:fatty-acyl-CoA synthase
MIETGNPDFSVEHTAYAPPGAWQPRVLREVLDATANVRGGSDAIITDRKRFNYAQVRDAAWARARALHALGIRKGDHIGILMGNNAAWVSLFWGAAIIGAVTVPVNTRFKSAELAFCLKQADVKALFLEDKFLNIDFVAFLREAEPAVDGVLPGANLPLLRYVAVMGENVPKAALRWKQDFKALEHKVDEAQFQKDVAAVASSDLLLIQFTSGTTAYPKGVMLTHQNMLRNAWAAGQRLGVVAEDRYFNCRPFYHVAGTTLSLLVALTFGCALVTLPTFEAGAALKMMDEERCTLTSGNDTLFQLMMSHETFDPKNVHLRGGWVAAGPQTVRKIIDLMGAKAICVAYGLSEASPNVVLSDWRDPEELRVNGLPLPHPGIEVRIADENGIVLPANAQGEIQVRGWNIMKGYYNNPEATAKSFTPDGWLKTGDLGTLNEQGRLAMIGRLKDVFRVGGENVAPAEVEEVLLAHPAVATSQVIGVPDARLGEVPAAYVTLKAGERVNPDELIAWCKARCANFRVPRYLRVVESFDAIGMTGSGKVQKNKLREYALGDFGLK